MSAEQIHDTPTKRSNSRFLRMLAGFRRFVRETMDLQWEAHIDSTTEIIRKDMIFRGHVVWVLVCSIFIASIGLNVNSTAVIIGAMLISPLMGPILATGLAVGTNDMDLLRRALKNFLIMVSVALTTSTVYFLLTPISDYQSELLARTRPTLLDAGVAIFGGIAGIIGVSRRNRGNVVPGVAIATALMPPLCTAGYGLATGQWNFLFGALYLFTLNAIFIALATVLIVRLLKFPLAKELNAKREKQVKMYMAIAVVLLLAPSVWVLYGITQEAIFRREVDRFVRANFPLEGTEILEQRVTYTDALQRLDLYLVGEPLGEGVRSVLDKQLLERNLGQVQLVIHQAGAANIDMQAMRSGIIEDIFDRNEQKLAEKDERIRELERQLDPIPMDALVREMAVVFPGISQFSYANAVVWNGSKLDTIPTAFVAWDTGLNEQTVKQREKVLNDWLEQRLGKKGMRVVREKR
jgi:uncharacterized hydrophobic protein (TIGR00271 family)